MRGPDGRPAYAQGHEAGSGVYTGLQMSPDELVMDGSDGNDWPTDDLFCLFREEPLSLRVAGPDGRNDHGTVGPANDWELRQLVALADSGGTRGVGGAHTYRGEPSPKVQAVLADWRKHKADLRTRKGKGDAVLSAKAAHAAAKLTPNS